MTEQKHREAAEGLDLEGETVIARVSSGRPGKTNWSVLTIYDVPGWMNRGRYIAEIIGETTREDQERRVRRAAFPTLAKALNWNAFAQGSSLYQELHRKVLDALDAGVGEQGEDYVRIPLLEPGQRMDIVCAPIQRQGFVAPAKNALAAAICWLYPSDGEPRLLGDVVKTFAADFGLDYDVVVEALEIERDEDCRPPHLVPAQPHVQVWVKAFIGALMFFDREAFWANREAGRG